MNGKQTASYVTKLSHIFLRHLTLFQQQRIYCVKYKQMAIVKGEMPRIWRKLALIYLMVKL